MNNRNEAIEFLRTNAPTIESAVLSKGFDVLLSRDDSLGKSECTYVVRAEAVSSPSYRFEFKFTVNQAGLIIISNSFRYLGYPKDFSGAILICDNLADLEGMIRVLRTTAANLATVRHGM